MPYRMEYNKNPISLREGQAYIDGIEVLDGVKMEIKFTPNVTAYTQIGDQTQSSRWTGGKFTGSMTRRRSTNFLRLKIKEYLKTGEIPEITVLGVMTDRTSDYYNNHGLIPVTATGCIMTGDIPLLALDTAGEFVEDTIEFNIKNVII